MASKKETYLFMRLIATLFFTIVLVGKAQALGLGMLKVNSNLDQPLDATIELLLNAGDDMSEIDVVMASRDDFDIFGVDYADYLSKINISFDNGDGQSLVQLQSEEIIKEPFLHFLVRVNWPGGSFLREYTALIDPPLYAAENPRSVTSPRVVGEDQSYTLTNEDVVEKVEQLEQAEVVQSEPVYTESDYDNEELSYQDDDKENDVADFSVVNEPDQVQNTSVDDARYGPIATGESLSQIASELQKQFSDLSIYQIMPILLEENPEAFIDNNINGLLKGAVLNISSVNRIREYDIDAGKQFFYNQIAEWASSSYNNAIADEVAVTSDSYLDAEEESGIDELFSEAGESSVDSNADQEFLVGAGNNYESALSAGDSTDNDAEILALETEIASLEVELQSSSIENQELRERISLLEGQLSDVNRLLSLEDTELSALESTLAEQNNDIIEGDAVLDPLEEDVLSETLVDNDIGLDGEGTDSLVGIDVTGDDVLSDAESIFSDTTYSENIDDTDFDILNDGEDVSAESDSVIAESLTENDTIAETTTAVKTVAMSDSKSFLDKAKEFVMGSAGWRLLAGIGAIILAFVGLIIYRRRRADEEFEISMMTIESHQTDDPDTKVSLNTTAQVSSILAGKDVAAAQMESEVQKAGDEVTIEQPTIGEVTKESSFLTVYSDSDAVVQSDEVDPVAEADVYIAYGRDEQAEEVLISGMDSFPERIDIKHKLLGLHHKNENSEEFERIAETVYADVDSIDTTIWSDICKMGLELNPDNPIFTATINSNASDLLADEAENFITKVEGSLPEAEVSIELDDDADASLQDAVEDSLPESVEDSLPESAEDSLSESVEDSSFINEVSQDVLDENTFTQDDIEFNDIEADEIEFEAITDDSDEVQLDMTDETSVDASVNSQSSKDDNDEIIEFDSLALEDIADIDDGDDENSFNEIIDSEISGLEFEDDYDEAETQYELAKVFSDLGDSEGAKRILKEIINDRHNKKELIEKASGLLETIDS